MATKWCIPQSDSWHLKLTEQTLTDSKIKNSLAKMYTSLINYPTDLYMEAAPVFIHTLLWHPSQILEHILNMYSKQIYWNFEPWIC